MTNRDGETLSSVLGPPGGPLPIGAPNYVRRPPDEEIDEILTNGRSPASIIVGPINGGTSSFLNRLYQRAQAAGCQASIAHFDVEFADRRAFTRLDLFKYLFRKIGMPEALFADRLDLDLMKVAFNDWAREAWKDADHVVLIIDGLDQIFRDAVSSADPLALINWLGALRVEAALEQPPFNKIAMFVALAGKLWDAGYGSLFGRQAAAIYLKKFTPPQIVRIFDQAGIDQGRYDPDRNFALFHGHPYLTQLFAWSMRRGMTEDEATAEALKLEGPYEHHWERMKLEIQYLIGAQSDLAKILAVVAEISAWSGMRLLSEFQNRVWQEHGPSLRVFGLVDGTKPNPVMCKFYRTAIENEQK